MEFVKGLKIFSLFVTVCAAAYIVRDSVYSHEKAGIEREYKQAFPMRKIDFVPFTVESAMMYSYACDVAKTGSIPEIDPLLVGMEREPVARRFTNGLEYFLGYGYRIKNKLLDLKPGPPSDFEDDPAFTKHLRVQLRAWISLVSGLVFLFLLAVRVPWLWALFGGLLHAFAPAAVARYTGQDIVRGDFDLTFIMATFTAAAWYLRAPSWRRLFLTAAAGFAALTFWDMTQICFAVWGVCELVRVASGGAANAKRRRLWMALAIATVTAAFATPYHRAHMLILSPLALCLIPTVLMAQRFATKFKGWKRVAATGAFLAVFLVAWTLVVKLGIGGGNYGHFASLMKAKIVNLNIKPADPSKLDFDARSVWVPAMHSATRYITAGFFPMALNMAATLLLGMVLFPEARRFFRRRMGLIQFPLFMTGFYFLGFLFLVRYHVFEILFLALLLPTLMWCWVEVAGQMAKEKLLHALAVPIAWFAAWRAYLGNVMAPGALLKAAVLPIIAVATGALFAMAAAFIVKRLPWIKANGKTVGRRAVANTFFALAAILVLMAELDGSLYSKRVYEPGFFPETAALIKWCRRESVRGETVLADFEISPLLKAYCGARIVTQPKFETKAAREEFHKFLDILFHGDEDKFAAFCVDNGAEYVIFDKGMANSTGLNSARYMADALDFLDPRCPAAMMAAPSGRRALRRLYEIKPPKDFAIASRRYAVFKVVSIDDKVNAIAWALDAEHASRQGNTALAARLAKAAVFADPFCQKADIMYRKIYGKGPEISLRGH